MPHTANAGPLADLVPPSPKEHGRFTGRKSMEEEIKELRDFIAEVLPTAIPQRYAELDGQVQQLEEMREQQRMEYEREKRELAEVRQEHAKLRVEVVELRDEAILQEVGVYNYRHPMENASDYKEALTELRRKIKGLARNGNAVSTTDSTWTVNDSKAKGRKMIRDTSKLLLRAYNNEADTLVDKLRPFKLEAAISRLEKSRAAINRLGAQPMEIAIGRRYHALRVLELELAADWLEKKEREKEEAKEERARLREEAKARKEIEEAKKRLLRNERNTPLLLKNYAKTGMKLRRPSRRGSLRKSTRISMM